MTGIRAKAAGFGAKQVARLLSLWRARLDGEQEMGRNRLVFGVSGLAFILIARPECLRQLAIVNLAYTLAATLLLIHLALRPAAATARRSAALVLDVVVLSLQLHTGGEPAALFISLYLWVALGNGFRFGVAWITLSVSIIIPCFSLVILTTPFWRSQLDLSVGVAAGLVALPIYAATLIRRLSSARLQAEAANKAKTLFLASISHELRTPLTAIIGMGGLLAETTLDADQREMTQVVNDAARTLLSQINHILDFSRIDAGQMPVQEVTFDLVSLMRETRGMVVSQAGAKGVMVSVHVTPRVPVLVTGSRSDLADIVTNLMGNAVKFTPAGRVLLRVDAEESDGPQARLSIEVCDTGIGIAAEDQERIFESFTQANAKILNDYGGTGLGLAISRRRAAQMGGSLEVRSSVGGGSVFRLSVEMLRAQRGNGEPPTLAGEHVIVVAANVPQATDLMARLAAMGASVQKVPSSAEAALAVRSAPDSSPVIMVMERGLGYDPITVVNLLKNDGVTRERPVVLVRRTEQEYDEALTWYFLSVTTESAGPREMQNVVRLASDYRAPGKRETHPPDKPRRGAAMRVLVADDSEVNRMVIAKILQSAGHSVVLVSDGEEALDVLGDEAQQFDAVVMDVNMQGMDGIEATKMYRFMELGRDRVPIIALTADATLEMAKRCVDAGMDAYITKPIEPDHLVSVVERLASGVPAPRVYAKVVQLAQHPRFRGGDAGADAMVIDMEKLSQLSALGGAAFVHGLIDAFLEEAALTVEHLASATMGGDVAAFRSLAHALRSSAVNVGARRLGELCDPWQRIEAAELAAQAVQFAQQARTAYVQTHDALTAAKDALMSAKPGEPPAD